MATSYDDIDAICPYFIRGDTRKIVCEGTSEYKLELLFDRRSERDAHRIKYCNCFEYGKCHVAKVIERVYDGQGNRY